MVTTGGALSRNVHPNKGDLIKPPLPTLGRDLGELFRTGEGGLDGEGGKGHSQLGAHQGWLTLLARAAETMLALVSCSFAKQLHRLLPLGMPPAGCEGGTLATGTGLLLNPCCVLLCCRCVLHTGQNADYTIVVQSDEGGEEEIPVHRMLLEARSPFFRGMLESNMAEAQQGRYVVRDIDANVFKALLHFIYTGVWVCGVSGAELLLLPGFLGSKQSPCSRCVVVQPG